jgi:dienelactone hydrolase
MRSTIAVMLAVILPAAAVRSDAPPATEKGTVEFTPQDDQKNIPERYRLEKNHFDYEVKKIKSLPVSGFEIYELKFPSPVKSATPENNTVHAEYYRPVGKGPFPCVIVLDILAGNQKLPQLIAGHLAQNKIAGLFVQMAYYGPRRPKGGKVRFLSPDVNHTINAIRQTVLDMRRATAWMESRPEIDGKRLGIMGVSLGSSMAGLSAEMGPKLGRVGIVLGGGGIVDAYYDDPRGATYRKLWEAVGGSKQKLAKMIAPVDPITHADRLKDRKVLMIAARNDEVVPPRMAEALWNASGRQQIIWLEGAGHYTAALHLLKGLTHIVKHFGE